MMNTNIGDISKRVLEFIRKNKYVMLVLLLGVILLLLPSANEGDEISKINTQSTYEGFSLSATEARLESVLSQIDGAGQVTVFLSVKSDGEKVIASDSQISENETGGDGKEEKSREETSSTVVISEGSGTEDVVTLKYIYPEYIGAVIVAEGADSSRVKLDITQAVEAVTGLTADRIKVIKMK